MIKRQEDMKDRADELLINAIDMHCHCYPEFTLEAKKRMEDLNWIILAAEMGMRGAVLKSHLWPTTTNVYFLQNQLPENFTLFSSIALNISSGGVNAWAVEAAAKQGAKVVWLPTWSSKHELRVKSMSRIIQKYITHLENHHFKGLKITDSHGLIPEAKAILGIAKEMDLVLCTGHISPAESLELAKQARDMGFQKLIFSHPDNLSVKANIQQMKDMVSLGAYVEFCFLGMLPLLQHKHPRDMAKLIRQVGAERCILSSDSFYDWPPPVPELMRMGIASLLEVGISEDEIKIMVQHNPACLLGLDIIEYH